MNRIRVTVDCVADHYADKREERIIEFFDPVTKLGGLIQFRRTEDGLVVQTYNHDIRVIVKEGKRA
jgi:hypothetical protein